MKQEGEENALYIEDSEPADLEGSQLLPLLLVQAFLDKDLVPANPSLHPVWSILPVRGTGAGVIDSRG